MRTAALALFLGLAGCGLLPSSPKPLQKISNPVEALREVSMLPVGAKTSAASVRWTERLQGSLLRVKGVDRVRVLQTVARKAESGVAKGVVELAEGTQCLIELNVLSFDAYFPPSARIEVNFYLPYRSLQSEWDPLTLERWGTGSGSSSTTDEGPWIRFQRRYSADA